MNASRTLWILPAVLLAAATGASAFSLGDVQVWTGTGVNQAMLVIDWNGNPSQSIAWGFRWNGTATGMDMLKALAGSGLIRNAYTGATVGTLHGADPRLYARLSTWVGANTSVFGLGYDVNNNASGFVSGTEGAATETGYANESADFYAEGWINPRWGYSVYVPGPGDANQDDEVGPEDFGMLKDNFGLDNNATWAMGDFNHDNEVGPEDFGILKDNFGLDYTGSWIAAPIGPSVRILSNNDRDAWVFGGGIEPHAPTAAGAPLTAAPEPLSLALLLLGGAVLPGRRTKFPAHGQPSPARLQ
ncbi:MAG: hypothetical protein NTV86_02875 [Planctomycetota bacterium]|nr:hypothetical protein [Planctomycetota bacterium]